MEISETPAVAAAVSTAWSMSGSLLVVDSNRMMLASGAMECAHSTSSDSSRSHSWPSPRATGRGDACPFWLSTFSVGPPVTLNCCRPYVLLNVAASDMMSGALYASTMAIVCPAPFPVTPPNEIRLTPYAACISAGVYGAERSLGLLFGLLLGGELSLPSMIYVGFAMPALARTCADKSCRSSRRSTTEPQHSAAGRSVFKRARRRGLTIGKRHFKRPFRHFQTDRDPARNAMMCCSPLAAG